MDNIRVYSDKLIPPESIMDKFPGIMDTVIMLKNGAAPADITYEVYKHLIDRFPTDYHFRAIPPFPSEIRAMKETIKGAATEYEKEIIRGKINKELEKYNILYKESVSHNLSNYYELAELRDEFERRNDYQRKGKIYRLLEEYESWAQKFFELAKKIDE